MSEDVPAPMSAREELLALADVPAIWRRGIGDAIAAIDVLKDKWAKSKRKSERETAAELDRVAQAVFDARQLRAPQSYKEAADAGHCLLAAARAASAKS